MLDIKDLPPLPEGWTWRFDAEGEPGALFSLPDGGTIEVYQAEVCRGHTGNIALHTRPGDNGFPFPAAPIAVFVAVNEAARLSCTRPESEDA